MPLTIKVFFEKADGKKEIRRFPVDSQAAPDVYAATTSRIVQLYPHLSGANSFQLFWEDSDGDRIVFSCKDEMQEAIKNVSDGVLRIYLKETLAAKTKAPKPAPEPKPRQQQQQQQQQQPPRGASEKTFHPGVTCDGCEGPVCSRPWSRCWPWDSPTPATGWATCSSSTRVTLWQCLMRSRPRPLSSWTVCATPGFRSGSHATGQSAPRRDLGQGHSLISCVIVFLETQAVIAENLI